MIFRKAISVCLFIIINSYSYGQMAGYYTVGLTGANFPTLQAALAELYASGMSDDVTLALIPGNYPTFTIEAIPGASENNWLTIESATLDSSDIIIQGTMVFYETSYVIINKLSIYAGDNRAMHFKRSWNVIINNCILHSYYQPNASYDGTVYIEHSWINNYEWSKLSFYNCNICGEYGSIYAKGNKSVTTINNCYINTNYQYGIHADCPNVNINNCDILGGLKVQTSGDIKFEGNTVEGLIEIGYIDSLVNNTFTSDKEIEISAANYINNHIHGLELSSAPIGHYANKKMIGNYIEAPIHFRQDKMVMIDNVFYGNITLSFTKELLFTKNEMYANLYYGDTYLYNWNYRVNNNIFSGGTLTSTGHNSEICYNNFVNNANLYLNYGDNKVHDNNFCRPIEGAANPDNVYHNNYYPLIYCYYDTLSLHYDPMYDPDMPGIATNPLLQGKGMTEAPEKDFLDHIRKNPPAIGANEIFICSDSLNNTVDMLCGDQVYLNLCNLPDTGTFWWEPDSLLNWPDSSYSMLSASSSTWAYLYNSLYGLVDSVLVNVSDFEVEIAPMPVFYCGIARTINASYHPTATYCWSPEDGLSDPNIRNPLLMISDTFNLEYILTCNVPGCGTSSDTLNIVFDPTPTVGIYYPTQNADTVFFKCISICVDDYLWEFGDGTTSTEENPYHIYEQTGDYEITLTGTNSYTSNSHTVIYHFYLVTVDQKTIIQDIKIFPNPVKDILHINGLPNGYFSIIDIINLSGQINISEKTTNSEINLDIQHLIPGSYIIRINTEENLTIRKIVVYD